ncbi:MAG: PilN domain-containing protein, partial [Nitrospirales bacterium]
LQTLPQHVAFAKELATHQKFSWTQLLNDLEAAVPIRISIESVTLDFRNSSIAVSGAALTLEDLSALVHGLEQHPAFQHIVVSNHKVQKKKDKKRKFSFIAFSLAVTYQPGEAAHAHQQIL